MPLNLFGRGKASAAAVDWVTGFTPGIPVSVNGWLPGRRHAAVQLTSSANKLRVIELEQDVFEISANGDLADGWAGPIAMAFGVAYRDEGFVQYVQAPRGQSDGGPADLRPGRRRTIAALGIRGVPGGRREQLGRSSSSPRCRSACGEFQVKEAFTEFRVPLVSDRDSPQQHGSRPRLPLGRLSRRRAGVGSWKGGFEWAITERSGCASTVSQDVRAANLGERYDRTGGVANVCDSGEDPVCAAGAPSRYDVTTVSGGNPAVKPEEAHTKTAGVVFRPGDQQLWNMAIDWYDIDIKDNINLYGVQNVINNCHKLGDIDSCAQIERNGPASTINPR